MTPRQLNLLPKERTEHGGDVREGKRKLDRPFSSHCSIHVVLRAPRARGRWSMLHRRNRSRIESLAYGWTRKKGVTIYRFANVGNHLHFLLRAPTSEALQQFLKTFAGLSARAVMGAKKGLRRGKFWEKTAYPKLIPKGAFRALCAYLEKNRLEAVGFGGARLRFYSSGEAVIVVGDLAREAGWSSRKPRSPPGQSPRGLRFLTR